MSQHASILSCRKPEHALIERSVARHLDDCTSHHVLMIYETTKQHVEECCVCPAQEPPAWLTDWIEKVFVVLVEIEEASGMAYKETLFVAVPISDLVVFS